LYTLSGMTVRPVATGRIRSSSFPGRVLLAVRGACAGDAGGVGRDVVRLCLSRSSAVQDDLDVFEEVVQVGVKVVRRHDGDVLDRAGLTEHEGLDGRLHRREHVLDGHQAVGLMDVGTGREDRQCHVGEAAGSGHQQALHRVVVDRRCAIVHDHQQVCRQTVGVAAERGVLGVEADQGDVAAALDRVEDLLVVLASDGRVSEVLEGHGDLGQDGQVEEDLVPGGGDADDDVGCGGGDESEDDIDGRLLRLRRHGCSLMHAGVTRTLHSGKYVYYSINVIKRQYTS
jgi:hypothetical protein